MSTILVKKLKSFKGYNFNEHSKNITNTNITDSDVTEFLEIIHLLDCEFVNYNILNNFSITILGKR